MNYEQLTIDYKPIVHRLSFFRLLITPSPHLPISVFRI
jgi:hypothetical protein